MNLKLTATLFFLGLCFSFFVLFIHEGAHTSLLLLNGRGPTTAFTGIVQVWDKVPQSLAGWQQAVGFENNNIGYIRQESQHETISEYSWELIIGPLATLLLSFFLFFLAKVQKLSKWSYLLMLFAFLNSFLAGRYYLVRIFSSGIYGDEHFAARAMNIEVIYLLMLFGSIHWLMIYYAGKYLLNERRYWGSWLSTSLGFLLGGVVAITLQNWIVEQVFAGNLWFEPLLGFSFPALLIYLITIAGGIILFLLAVREMHPKSKA